MGDAIDVVLKATNTSQDVRTLSGRLALSTMYYTGVHYRNVNSISIGDKVLEKGQSMLAKMQTIFNYFGGQSLLALKLLFYLIRRLLFHFKSIFSDEKTRSTTKILNTMRSSVES